MAKTDGREDGAAIIVSRGYVNAWNRLPRGGVMLGRFAWVPHSGLLLMTHYATLTHTDCFTIHLTIPMVVVDGG
jgi:hypothetical protein